MPDKKIVFTYYKIRRCIYTSKTSEQFNCCERMIELYKTHDKFLGESLEKILKDVKKIWET